MGVYLGSNLFKININGIAYTFRFVFGEPITNYLRSSDGYVLKDVNGLYLKPKESE